jgi:hypothetical protein
MVASHRGGESPSGRPGDPWESRGEGVFTVEEVERESRGTSVTVHLKPADEDDGIRDYTDEWVVREIVKKYSDFVAYPIRLPVERREVERGADGKPKPGATEQVVRHEETLNSMKAVWARPKSEVYRSTRSSTSIFRDWTDPLETIGMEGRLPTSLFLLHTSRGMRCDGDGTMGSARVAVFAMDDWSDPDYLRSCGGGPDDSRSMCPGPATRPADPGHPQLSGPQGSRQLRACSKRSRTVSDVLANRRSQSRVCTAGGTGRKETLPARRSPSSQMATSPRWRSTSPG